MKVFQLISLIYKSKWKDRWIQETWLAYPTQGKNEKTTIGLYSLFISCTRSLFVVPKSWLIPARSSAPHTLRSKALIVITILIVIIVCFGPLILCISKVCISISSATSVRTPRSRPALENDSTYQETWKYTHINPDIYSF